MEQLPTIEDAVEMIRAGKLSPVDVVEHCLHRIEQFESQIHAWVTVDQVGARYEAERLAQLATRGEIVGPLHGIPIGIKDIIDVAGMPTRCGSPLRDDTPAARDAMVVANLRRAGAIILGKTVTTEWACFDPPPTRNPWNVDRTPGGSSSGSAAAVATEMCAAAIGTQTGGSIIRPAAYCGIAGLKPTFAPEMMDGIAPVSFHLDHVGPLARSTAELKTVYAAMYGVEAGTTQQATPPKLALLHEYYHDEIHPDVRSIVATAIEQLGDAEFATAPVLPRSFTELHEHHHRIMSVEAAHVHRKAFAESPEKFGPGMRTLIEKGLTSSLSDYVAALHHQQHFRTEILRTYHAAPILAMPATTSTAPGRETTGDPRLNIPWSYCGLPAMTLRCGNSEGRLPVGLQLVAPYHCEGELLLAAAWCERRLNVTPLPIFKSQ